MNRFLMRERMKTRNKKIAKGKKKSWRSIDISDIEQHLEDERLQERTGGLVADKPDQRLFFVDKDVQKDQQIDQSEPHLKRKRREPRRLRCFAILDPDPNIKPARIAHNIPQNSHLNKPGKVLEKLAQGHKSLKQVTAERQSQAARRLRQSHIRSSRRSLRATYDLWQDNQNKVDKRDEHYMKVTRRRRVNVPNHYHDKMSKLPAVEVPHPGSSYNPAYEDYQNLLRKANAVEEKKVKEEKKLFNSLNYPKAGAVPTEEIWLEEMSAGLQGNDMNEEDALKTDTDDWITFNPAVRREDEKTEKQKKKEQKAKLEIKKLVTNKVKRRTENEIFRIKTIKAEIRKKEKQIEKKKKKKEELKEQAAWKTKKLGKMKYEIPELELKLSDELYGSLRQLKPEGNLLFDRFKSLQKRNVIEPRTLAVRKNRYKKKLFEKKGHKEIVV